MIDYLIFTLTLLTQSLFIGKGFFPFIFFIIHCSRNWRRNIHDWLSLIYSYIAHADILV